METIYLVIDICGAIHFVKGENVEDVARKFMYFEYLNVDSMPEGRKEEYKNKILNNFTIISLSDFDSHGICDTSVYANVKYEDSNEIELTVDKCNIS